jgi:outer membrane lipoprotein-sorting protein
VIISAVNSTAQGFTLKARDRRKQVEGYVTMTFGQDAAGNVTLQSWTVVDQQNRPTTVTLTSMTRGAALKPSLFVLNKPQGAK